MRQHICQQKFQNVMCFSAMYYQDLQQWILSLVVAVVGGLGNGILLLAHMRRKPPLQGKMKVAMHFMVSLAAIDFTVCVIILPIEILTFANHYQNYPDIACKVFAFGRLMGLYSSNFLLVAIAVDRFIAVCFPFSTGITYRMARYITLVCVLGGALVAAPNLYLFKVQVSPDMKMQRCQMTEIPALETFRRFLTFTLFAIFIVSVITIITLYSLVYRKVYLKEKKLMKMKQATPISTRSCYQPCSVAGEARSNAISMVPLQTVNEDPPADPIAQNKEEHELEMIPINQKTQSTSYDTNDQFSRWKKTRQAPEPSLGCTGNPANSLVSRTAFMLVLVTAVFVFSWLPYWIINMIAMTHYFHGVSQTETMIALFFSSLFYINNAVNPIIYTFASSSFRKDIQKHAFCSSNNGNNFH